MQAFLILDIPSPAHINSLVNSFKESELYRKIWSEDGTSPPSVPDLELRAIYHLCGDGVLKDSRYKNFLNGFGPHVHVRHSITFIYIKLKEDVPLSTSSRQKNTVQIRLHLLLPPTVNYDSTIWMRRCSLYQNTPLHQRKTFIVRCL